MQLAALKIIENSITTFQTGANDTFAYVLVDDERGLQIGKDLNISSLKINSQSWHNIFTP